jgi:hypothetical protein
MIPAAIPAAQKQAHVTQQTSCEETGEGSVIFLSRDKFGGQGWIRTSVR